MTIPRGGDDWATVQIINLSEAAALGLALNFFLGGTGNRADRLHLAKKQKFISVMPTKENCYGRGL
jgi:hypothetical protein